MRRRLRRMAECDHRECHFTFGIDIEQAVHLRVHESANHLGRHSKSRGHGQQIAQESAVIPTEMTIGASLVFPSVAPVGAGANDRRRGMEYRCFSASGLGQNSAIIAGSQFAQGKIRGRKVVDAGFQTGKIATNYIELDLIERAGACCGAEVDLAASILPMPSDARG